MKKIFWILTGVVLLTAGCKKEFSKAGYDLIKDGDYQFDEYSAQIKIYSNPVEKVLSQNPGLINLGVYKHPAFGLSTADMLIQFNTSEGFNSLNFRNADSILYVELRIPYFSTKNEELSTDTDPVYDLDSVFGNRPFKVQAYESQYYLFPFDPNTNFQQIQYFYSDFDFLSHTGNLLADYDQFYPLPDYLVDTLRVNGNVDLPDSEIKPEFSGDTLHPHFVLKLDTAYFKTKFFDRAGMTILTDNELFKNYFRGIYLHVEPVNNNGSYILFKQGSVQLVLAYRYVFMNDNGTPNDSSDDYPDHAYEKIVLPGVLVINHYEKDFYPQLNQKLQSPDRVNGEAKVYVKGTAGAMGIVELFTPSELYNLRNNNWLINQANIRFYLDENEMAGIEEEQIPAQLYLYKVDQGAPITDLTIELDDGTSAPVNDVIRVYDGTLQKDEDTGERYYEFNVTRHVKDILRKDSSNVRLGLRVSTALSDYIQSRQQGLADPDAYIPYGVVLQGNRSTDKPVEFKIYYTKPQN